MILTNKSNNKKKLFPKKATFENYFLFDKNKFTFFSEIVSKQSKPNLVNKSKSTLNLIFLWLMAMRNHLGITAIFFEIDKTFKF